MISLIFRLTTSRQYQSNIILATRYIVNVMLEYGLSLREASLIPAPFLDELLVNGLVACGDFDQLAQLLQYGVLRLALAQMAAPDSV